MRIRPCGLWRHLLRLAAIIWCLLPSPAQALITGGYGNGDVPDHNWRAGSVELANLATRIGWWEGPPFGGGMWTFMYRGDTAAFNDALQVFAAIRAPSLELIVADGPAESPIQGNGKEADRPYDWHFVIWDAQGYYRLYGDPRATFLADSPEYRRPLPPPQITLFVTAGGPIVWSDVQVPEGIQVIDRRAVAAGIKEGEGATVAGDVFDMATSKPLPGVQIQIDRMKADGKYETALSGRSDEAGRFRIGKIPAGTYRVCARKEGYAPLLVAHPRLVRDGYAAFEDGELCPLASMSGTVVDEAGKPVQGAVVLAGDTLGMNGMGYRLPDSLEATTDAQGRFELRGLPRGLARPWCRAKGLYAPMADLTEIPSAQIAIHMRGTGGITGKVIDASGHRLAGGASVSLEPEGGERVGQWSAATEIKPDGSFKIEGIPAGKYVISARRNPSPAETKDQKKVLTIVVGETQTVELTVP